MSGKTVRAITVCALLIAGGMHAPAQTSAPTENGTVTATKSREVLGKFAKAFAAPTKFAGKLARWEHSAWEHGVCPFAMGQNPHFTAFITQRIKYIALAVGAPVNTDASCIPNIEIIFTTTPQALLDNVRKDNPDYLGYAANRAQFEKLATVTRPIQAWYTTETIDFFGRRQLDSVITMRSNGELVFWPSDNSSGGLSASTVGGAGKGGGGQGGGGIGDSNHAVFFHILIVIDSTKLAGQKMVPLADYISMLALTQLNSLDTCQQLPSIVSIMAPNCDQKVEGLTEFDFAYLKGLYQMSAERKLLFEQNDIGDAMEETLAKRK